MKRAFLTDLGITDSEVIKKIIDFHQNVAQDLKDELSKVSGDLKIAKSDLKSANETIADLQSNAVDSESENYKQKYNDEVKAHDETRTTMKREMDDYIASEEAKKTAAIKQAALEKSISEAGANPNYIKKIAKDFDIDAIEMDGDKIKDFDKKLEAIKPLWVGMFCTTKTQGTETVNPSTGNVKKDYIALLDAARKSKDTQEAIKIKMEAAEDGVYLI